jgi:heme A synthase
MNVNSLPDSRYEVAPWYRRLVATAFVITILLIVVGGIVRVSGSGLGCGPAGSGVHGWPLCEGGVIPADDAEQMTEYSHRALASALGLLLLVIAGVAIKRYRRDRRIVALSGFAAGLVIFEGLLGGLVVEHDLHPVLVAVHLGIAMLVAALLLTLWFVIKRPDARPRAPHKTRWLALFALDATWLTIFFGGWVAGTEKHGSLTAPVDGGAHYACGTDFPGCQGRFLPIAQGYAVNLQLAHRLLMYLTAIFVLSLVVVAWRRSRGLRLEALLVLCLLGTQILLGALNVLLLQEQVLVLAHLTVGTLLWLAVVWLSLRTLIDPAEESATIP